MFKIEATTAAATIIRKREKQKDCTHTNTNVFCYGICMYEHIMRHDDMN